MKILVADDQATNRKLLRAILTAEGFDVQEARDGGEALAILQTTAEPLVALIDWQMPVHTGIDVCREARRGANAGQLFLILVTVRDRTVDIVEGLQAGANDYVTKPFEPAELLARVRVGRQMVELQATLVRRVQELEVAMADVRQLRSFLPICSYCKKIRDDQNYWQQIETYLAEHADVRFSHSVCPGCFEHHLQPQLKKLGLSADQIGRVNPPVPQPDP